MAQENQNCSNQLNEKVDREKVSDRFLRQLDSFISNYEGQLPNLQDIFSPKTMDWLLSRSAKHINDTDETRRFIKFVARTGYKDEPEVDEDGKHLLLRTTPIHYAMKNCNVNILPDLFKIYHRFDVNYTDEDGLTHFHVACALGREDVVEKFLDHGQDPNGLVTKTGDSPLLLAVKQNSKEVIELLLSRGANPNLANKVGEVALHVIYDVEVGKMLFELSNANYQPVRVDAQDNLGNTPLHVAMACRQKWLIELLLRRGADPNRVNAEGSTPLHIVCKEIWHSGGILEVFFKIAKEVDQVVEVDARDRKGRTPLQWAVANFLPDVVELLFDQGADLSNFVFPTESQIFDGFQLPRDESTKMDLKMILPPRAMEVVKLLKRRGYDLARSDAMTIMRVLAKNKLFEKSDEKCWHDVAKKISMPSGRSLYDAIRLAPSEVAKLLRYDDYEYTWPSNAMYQLPPGLDEICAKHLCERTTRRFFRKWALDCLMELTHYRLEILHCYMIMIELNNEDLFNICLAATDRSLR